MRMTSLVLAMAASVPVASAADKNVIVGSGKIVAKEIKLADFKAIDVSSAFKVKITRADAFAVSVSADDNAIEFVKVNKKDGTLQISLDTSKNRSFQKVVFSATIAMPALEAVNLSGATSATLSGFKSTQGFKAKLSGACSMAGDVEASKLEVEAIGASTVALKGAAKEATLSAVGASELKLADFSLANSAVNLSGASSAAVNAKEKLDYTLSGASSLQYSGNPKIGKSEASGASSARRK